MESGVKFFCSSHNFLKTKTRTTIIFIGPKKAVKYPRKDEQNCWQPLVTARKRKRRPVEKMYAVCRCENPKVGAMAGPAITGTLPMPRIPTRIQIDMIIRRTLAP